MQFESDACWEKKEETLESSIVIGSFILWQNSHLNEFFTPNHEY